MNPATDRGPTVLSKVIAAISMSLDGYVAGAGIMGRKMFSGGTGGWDDDPRARGWWGEDPPFHTPVFVLTHHAREPLPMAGETTFTFVTAGIESALEQARAAAGDKEVRVLESPSGVTHVKLRAG